MVFTQEDLPTGAAWALPRPYEGGTGEGGTGEGPPGESADEGAGGVPLTGARLLAVRAAGYADVCVIGVLTADATGTSCDLAVRAPDAESLPDGARPVILRGTTAYGAALADGHADWLPLRRITVAAADGTRHDLAGLEEARRVEVLTRAGLDTVEQYADTRARGRTTRTGGSLLTPGQRGLVRAAERETLVPLAKGCGLLAATLAQPLGADVAALRQLQERCLGLYGRLEPERALAWALEELGELSQAMRRGESSVRLEEELGQVLVWALCLANITRTDSAHAFAKAFSSERDRQVRTHGAVRPYRREVLPC
ncbi:MazG nucleotide pyrophosphohydrolase domain-containing protein [Streptomyces sp. NPDC051567]|uniref:MazG nucleotide pyrophosphohydrolase domain-containing protein n=1 Tax=Streptomyces sp. NPDC051567 TaxID=3365660 RepID=UPI003787C77E